MPLPPPRSQHCAAFAAELAFLATEGALMAALAPYDSRARATVAGLAAARGGQSPHAVA